MVDFRRHRPACGEQAGQGGRVARKAETQIRIFIRVHGGDAVRGAQRYRGEPFRPDGGGALANHAAGATGAIVRNQQHAVLAGTARCVPTRDIEPPPGIVQGVLGNKSFDTPVIRGMQRIEQHRDQPGCRQCHAKIDPWGIAFEQFDAGGRLKPQSVDAKSTLPDKTEIDGANDLKHYLADERIDQVAFSFLKHLTTYATGRTLSYNEQAWLKQDSLKLKAGGYRMQDMFRYVVDSKMFLEK